MFELYLKRLSLPLLLALFLVFCLSCEKSMENPVPSQNIPPMENSHDSHNSHSSHPVPQYRSITGISGLERVARLTGAKDSDSMNPTWEADIGGVDLGSMINHKNHVYFLFGDSFSSELAYWGKPGTGEGWRWNTMAFSSDALPSDGILFDGWIADDNGRAREFIHDSRYNPVTNIPTGGIGIGNKMFVWYMAMKFWGDKNDPCWKPHFSSLAWSDDEGKTFHIQEDFQFPANSNFGMVSAAFSSDDPNSRDYFVYLWGTPANRCGGVKLARVRPDLIMCIHDYQYFAGVKDSKPLWVNSEENATLIFEPEVGEMSVMFDKWANSWIMMHGKFNPKGEWLKHAGDIVLRQAPAPWGPWSDPILVIPFDLPGFPYGSYMNPLYVENDGEIVYFIMSLWDPYDVYLVKVKLLSE